MTNPDRGAPIQDHLFDADRARQARDGAIERVGLHVPPDWKLAALRAVYGVCRRRLRASPDLAEFTTDAAVELLQRICIGDPPEPRAWGDVMQTARRRGWCEPTDRMQPSSDVTCHRRKKQVWRVLPSIPEWDGVSDE